MKHLVFTVRDKAIGAFLQPFFTRSKGEAVRSFMEACNDPKHNFNRNSSDYTLFYLGDFDDVSGLFNPQDPERVLAAFECLGDVNRDLPEQPDNVLSLK